MQRAGYGVFHSVRKHRGRAGHERDSVDYALIQAARDVGAERIALVVSQRRLQCPVDRVARLRGRRDGFGLSYDKAGRYAAYEVKTHLIALLIAHVVHDFEHDRLAHQVDSVLYRRSGCAYAVCRALSDLSACIKAHLLHDLGIGFFGCSEYGGGFGDNVSCLLSRLVILQQIICQLFKRGD